jgi:hypothetical protein
MATDTPHRTDDGSSRLYHLGTLMLVAAVCLFALGNRLEGSRSQIGTDGTAPHADAWRRPTVAAAFPRESYRPGATARLVVTDVARHIRVQLFRAGYGRGQLEARDLMRGRPVAPAIDAGAVRGRRILPLRLGDWPSGLYYARLTASGGRIGFAPFVLRPRRLGAHRVALVLPTFTWQAYSFFDDDNDGDADTWYAGLDEQTVRIGRPYDNRGVPPHYKYYDEPFLRWLMRTGRDVDYLSDSDLDRTTGRTLANAYRLVIFNGHHEYTTLREFENVRDYRDRGGNLMFLSANNLFFRVVRSGNVLRKAGKFRELGRPEAAIIGVQYVGNDEGQSRGPWIVRDVAATPWIFAGTGLGRGSRLSSGGIEIDEVAPSSPPQTKVLAEIPNLLGHGMSGHMTYYETRAGARVFAAGAFTLAGAIWQPQVRRLVANLWRRLARP